ncbi:MAG: helix-turn-helix domain-containing protein [Phascolarctobacterium sp.]|uniref:helix-turn-helix transcriptional regulator n=1 Tax=Phascolarctobacterium sp. TaxID=2049039 RepID=UPI0025E0FDC3|nr:helix-turn-helix transcriptional regulator [Phascolarctobacterium sp.]MCC8158495.1 helix-turn-helix domain-containing protein [Phascolarctobacterium sp.]
MVKFDYKKMGMEIKVHRFYCDITQSKLAEQLGISQAHLCNIENGRLSPSLKLLVALRNVFKCSLDELIVEIEPEEESGKV